MQQVAQTQSLQANTIERAILALSDRDTDHAPGCSGHGYPLLLFIERGFCMVG